MAIRGSNISCGVNELVGLQNDPKGTLKEFYLRSHTVAFTLFSDALACQRGQKFATLIRKHGLGTLQASGARMNPNSGRRIRVWIWSPDYGKIRAIAKKEGWKKY